MVQYIYTVFITAVLAAMLLENLIIFLLWKEYSTGVLGFFFCMVSHVYENNGSSK